MKAYSFVSVAALSVALLVSAQTALADGNHHGDNDRDYGRDYNRDYDHGYSHELESKQREIRIGFNIAPVTLDTAGKSWRLIGLGSYIVNAQGSCNDCHTHPNFAPGGDPFSGQPEVVNFEQYLTGGRVFGPFKSKNLTPDAFGRPAGLTFEQFTNLLRTGRDPDEVGPDGLPRILQVMPWPVIGKMTDLDLRAIYEYLRAIPSRPDNPAPGP